MSGCEYEFTTGNYRVTTRPRAEWRLVMGRKSKSQEEFEEWLGGGWLDGESKAVGLGSAAHGRRIPNLDELMALPSREQAKLREEEVLAVVLYTGPMVSRAAEIVSFCSRAH